MQTSGAVCSTLSASDREHFVEGSDALFVVLDGEGRLMRAGWSILAALGLDERLLCGQHLIDLVHPRDQASVRNALDVVHRRNSALFECRLCDRDGAARWYAWRLYLPVGELDIYATAHDITDRKAAELALQSETAFRRAMEESVATGLRVIDLSGQIIYVNPAFCRLTGFSPEELIGARAPFPYWPEDATEPCAQLLADTLAGRLQPSGFEMPVTRKDGTQLVTRFYLSPLVDANGVQTGWMAAVTDITERKRMAEMARLQDERLQRTARLVTMGEMASMLAHELNQPLTAISNYSMGCVSRIDGGCADLTQLRAAMEKASLQAQRAAGIIRRMGDFVKKRAPQRICANLEQIVRDAISFAELEARRAGIAIQLVYEANRRMVHADPIMIEQVLLNLIKNGVEAMAGMPLAEARLQVRVSDEGRRLRVAVSDRGHGIRVTDHEQLFAPFYTTKPEGMGLGLNICRSIIEFHDDHLQVAAAPDGGTMFSFALPCVIDGKHDFPE